MDPPAVAAGGMIVSWIDATLPANRSTLRTPWFSRRNCSSRPATRASSLGASSRSAGCQIRRRCLSRLASKVLVQPLVEFVDRPLHTLPPSSFPRSSCPTVAARSGNTYESGAGRASCRRESADPMSPSSSSMASGGNRARKRTGTAPQVHSGASAVGNCCPVNAAMPRSSCEPGGRKAKRAGPEKRRVLHSPTAYDRRGSGQARVPPGRPTRVPLPPRLVHRDRARTPCAPDSATSVHGHAPDACPPGCTRAARAGGGGSPLAPLDSPTRRASAEAVDGPSKRKSSRSSSRSG